MSGGKGRSLAAVGSWNGGEDEDVARKVRSSLKVLENFWSEDVCTDIEAEIDRISATARQRLFKPKTLDRTPLRSKYFFGYGYTYGSQISKKGGEQLLPPGMVDEIPDWIREKLIKPVEDQGLVPLGWINSAVVNDYRPGGMIVSHVDPPKLFARPIIINTFFAEGRLVFGCRFSFPNKGGAPETTQPKCICPMPRGSLSIMQGFSADGITHGLRPEDMDGRRVSIVLRHVFEDAPKFGDPEEVAPSQVPDASPKQALYPSAKVVPPPPPTLAQLPGGMSQDKLVEFALAQVQIIAQEQRSRQLATVTLPMSTALQIGGQSSQEIHAHSDEKTAMDEERHKIIEEEVDDFGRRKHTDGKDAEKGKDDAVAIVEEKKRNSGRAMSDKQKAALARLHGRHQKTQARSRSPRR